MCYEQEISTKIAGVTANTRTMCVLISHIIMINQLEGLALHSVGTFLKYPNILSLGFKLTNFISL